MSGLKRLTIDHLRGSVVPFSLTFEKGKKLTVIYGENGAGKSTICDAFDFLGEGRVGSIENRGLGMTARFWPSLGKKSSDVGVHLETTGSACRAVIRKSNVVVIPPENRPYVEVFRRRQILSLIEATPGARYDAIRKFIDVSGIEASEATLRELIRGLNDSRKVAVAIVHENEDELRRSWETAGKPGKDWLTWAKGEASRDTEAFKTEINDLITLQAAYNRLADYPERLQSADQALKAAKALESDAIKRVKECLKSVAMDAEETVSVLEAAKTYLTRYPSPSVCPLCESSEKAAELAVRVAKRLSTFSMLQEAKKQEGAAKQSVQLATNQLKVIYEDTKKDASNFEKCRSEHVWSSEIILPGAPAPESASALKVWLAETDHLAKGWKDAENSRYDKKQVLTNLQKALENWQTNSDTQRTLDRLLPRLTRALEILEEERRSFTDSVLADIAKEVGRLYEAVHPGEGLDKISLQLDPNKRASLKMEANFCGECAPPQAYFSDSHLDTLGLCVFLALAAL
ncbi:MAG: ATP-binding protein, partial [Syntrophobacteraceae bacterium]